MLRASGGLRNMRRRASAYNTRASGGIGRRARLKIWF
ncbi:MAG: hypothetical protein JWO54_374 [Candidatus Saccharibacteria bacterium]|nr:hypothetical protein [Candidatus Saccharibacteria bacterium]